MTGWWENWVLVSVSTFVGTSFPQKGNVFSEEFISRAVGELNPA